MERILVPVDFSEESENAVKVAAELARKFDSEIFLLHILDLPLTTVDPMSTHSALPEAMFFMQMAHKRFKKIMSKKYLRGITVHEKVKRHLIHEGINETCEENDCDMIIMGSHGATGFKEMFVGSNAEKVVRTAKIPVMVIKSYHEHFSVQDFVFASDFKKDSIETYKKAADLADLLESTLHLLIVDLPGTFDNHSDAEARIKEFIKGHEYKDHTINVVSANKVEKGILDFSKDLNADLIGISTHGRQGISHFFNGSIGEDVANHAKRPVVTFRIPDDTSLTP